MAEDNIIQGISAKLGTKNCSGLLAGAFRVIVYDYGVVGMRDG